MAELTTLGALVINDIISFTCYGNGVVSNVVDGTIVGFESGVSLRNSNQAAVNHANIYSSLPDNPSAPVPDDYTKYTYLYLQLQDDSFVEIGLPWIQPGSLTRLVRKTATAVIRDFDISQLEILQDMFTMNGYLNVEITVS